MVALNIKPTVFKKIAMWLVCAYIFFCCMPHNPAARYGLLVFILIWLLIGFYRRELKLTAPFCVKSSLAIFVGVALISAMISPFVLESLNSFRKDYAPPLLVVFLGCSLRQDRKEKIEFAKYVLGSLLAGFVLKTLLAFWDGAILNPFVFSVYSNADFIRQNHGLPKYVEFYAVEAVLYITLASAVLLYLTKDRVVRFTLSFICLLSLCMIFASGIRTAVVSTALAILLLALIKIRSLKKVAIILVIASSIGSGILILGKSNPDIERYRSLLNVDSYVKKDTDTSAFAGRLYIWEGMYEIIRQRPLLGYGPGWQKIPEVARKTGIIEKWKGGVTTYNNRYKLDYFSLERGQVNPHNLFVQILFETGLLGLVSYIAFIACLAICALKMPPSIQVVSPLSRWLKQIILIYVLIYIVMSITNAFLLHNTLIALALIAVLVKDTCNST